MQKVKRTGRLDFAQLSGCGVKVAIVDSGIDPTHPRIGKISGGVRLAIGAGGTVIEDGDFADCAGHGTACAGIIRQKAPEAELFSVRIFDASLTTNARLLVAALQWTIDWRIDVVNLSLGTTDAGLREKLAEICRQASERGLILIAAEHNEGWESYPAQFPEVIGVAAGELAGRYAYRYRPGQVIECVARGDVQRLCWRQPREIMAGGTSFAAPHIAGIVALIRQFQPRASLREVREFMEANASPQDPGAIQGKRPSGPPWKPGRGTPMGAFPVSPATPGRRSFEDRLRCAVLYPYNKEMHSFVRYPELLNFRIVGIADPVGKGMVGKDAGEALGIPAAGIRIGASLEELLPQADTLILGYVDRLASMAGRDLLADCIRLAIDRDVQVFSFLAVSPTRYGQLCARAWEKGLEIRYPWIGAGEVREALRRLQEYGPVEAPVLGVFGTSSQQGKFTVQLALRRELLARGYQVGQIGTEPHASLFGMDFTFPMGYASPLEIPVQCYAPLLEFKMRELCRRRRPEIVVVGGQSGTIPYDVEEHGTDSLPYLAFLVGTRPDACILVVNSIDPDEYIQDSIDAIRALVKAPTILLAMSDKEKHLRAAYGRTWFAPRSLLREKIDARLAQLEAKFRLPAVEIVSREGQRKMADVVVGFFAARQLPATG